MKTVASRSAVNKNRFTPCVLAGRGLDQLFLGHAPASIAEKHYSATGKNALDAAMEYLREEYQISRIMESAPGETDAEHV